MKRLLVLLLVFSLILPTAVSVFAENVTISAEAPVASAEDAVLSDGAAKGEETPKEEKEKEPYYSRTVAVLSNITAISRSGLKATNEYTKSGSFTALMEGDALYKNFTLPVTTSDFTKGDYIELYVYSPATTAMRFALVLNADNPETEVKDYYYYIANANFSGWKNISTRISTLPFVGTPLGLDSIESLEIMPGYGSDKVPANAKLYFDDIRITNEQSADANVAEAGIQMKPIILMDAADGMPGRSVRLSATTFQDEPVIKWGPNEGVHEGNLQFSFEDVDLRPYKYMVWRIYSVKNTNQDVHITIAAADNPETDGSDYYYNNFVINWEGEWRDVKMAIAGGPDDNGDFSKTREPNHLVRESTSLSSTMYGWAVDENPDTQIYISKIWVEGSADEVEMEIIGDYIPEDNYNPDTMVDYVSKIRELHPNNGHPRVGLTPEKVQQILKYKDTDKFLKDCYDKVILEAENWVNTKPTTPLIKTGNVERLNCTPMKEVAEYCGMAYLFTGNTKYADRVWKEIEMMGKSSQLWTRVNYLDAGVAVYGAALAYDWCYDYWDKDQKSEIRNTMFLKCLTDMITDIRMGGTGSGFGLKNNVASVDAKGMMSALLAIADEPGYENICNEMINQLIKVMPDMFMFNAEPHGAYGEGTAYWNLSMKTFFNMTNGMKTAMGTEGGLEQTTGMKLTGYFPIGMRGPLGEFNHSDSSKHVFRDGVPLYLYLAETYNIPALRTLRLNTYTFNTLEADDILWYNPETPTQLDWRDNLDLDYFWSGVEPLLTMRSSFETDAFFIAGKGGNQRAGHDQADIGSFVLDALGVRWIEDLGAETYYHDIDRMHYYRMRAEGNNCLQVNPKEARLNDQYMGIGQWDTLCDFVDQGQSEGAGYGVFNNTPAYKDMLKEYKRGFALVNNRTQFIVQDEFVAEKADSEIYAYYHTGIDNKIEIGKDGKSLMMTAPDGTKCRVDFDCTVPFEIGQMEAVHHPSSPQPSENNLPGETNKGFHKFYVHMPKVTNARLTVTFSPIAGDASMINLPKVLPFSEWSSYLENSAVISSISVDGVPVAFNEGTGIYKIKSDKVGTVTATAPEGVSVSIKQAENFGDAAYITAKTTGSASGVKQSVYKVFFTELKNPPQASGTEIKKITASKEPEAVNPIPHAIDGNIGTRWSADGDVWLLADLGTPQLVEASSLAFYNGHTRHNVFELEVSLDGKEFTRVFEGQSPGNTSDLVRYDFEQPVMAQYIRFVGHGCVNAAGEFVNVFNSVSEFVIHGTPVDFDDTLGHWAQDDIFFLRKYGLVTGVSGNTYAPENKVTVAEFLTMVARACSFEEKEYTNGTFNDVTKDDWFAPYVAMADFYEYIPAEMVTDGNLNPNAPLTREQMSAIATLAYSASAKRSCPESGVVKMFTDVNLDSPYAKYIDRAIGIRIVNGMTPTTFAPNATLTRAQAATILKRVFVNAYNVNN